MITYSKLRDGSWGLRGAGLVAGASVVVTKKSGETKAVLVGRVLWTSPDGATSLATVAGNGGSPPRGATGGWPGSRGQFAPGGRTCSYCGSRECAKAWDPRDLCDED